MFLLFAPVLAQETPDISGASDAKEPISLDHEDLEVVHREFPTHPNTSDGLVRCKVEVDIGVNGAPEAVRTLDTEEGCEGTFATSAVEAVERWRWRPVKIEGAPARARTVVAIIFKPGNTGTLSKGGPDIPLRGDLSASDRKMAKQAFAFTDERRAEHEPCQIQVTLHPDDKVSDWITNDIELCLLVPAGGAAVRKSVWKSVSAPTTCVVDFQPEGSRNTKIRPRKECPKKLGVAAALLLDEWRANGVPDLPYQMAMTFQP